MREDFGYHERHELPSRYWEPAPDEEDLERMEREYTDDGDCEPLPFE